MLLAAHKPLLPRLGLRSWDRPSSRRSPTRICAQASDLVLKKCQPCEGDGGAMQFMGMCQAMTRTQAEDFLQHVEAGWSLVEDEQGRLSVRRKWKAKNFLKALELCDRIGEVAEGEGHHPDLHLTGWNWLEVVLSTHARGGLTENDFIMAAKIDALDKEGLLRGKRQRFADI